MEKSIPVAYDLSSHHALGGGSYAFKTRYPLYLKTLLSDRSRRTEVNIIIQPYSPAHIGTMCSLGLAFILARRLIDEGLDVSVTCDLWDRAKGEEMTIDGVVYQKSLRDKGTFQKHLPGYVQIINELASQYRVHHRIRMEEEFGSNPEIPDVRCEIVIRRELYGKVLAPERGSLAFRASCPECGLVEKYGTRNVYADDGSAVTFQCPSHGLFTCNAPKRKATDSSSTASSSILSLDSSTKKHLTTGLRFAEAIMRGSGRSNCYGDFCPSP
ncbi:hypothetical protein FVEG_17584 [Fusarium verticillioides 7600]|uniref:Uncharacterized protein n=1 Tax=Gibberella moniliformis (strain M3125 / FGSC 7600) TaxID=334819 RepID=W7MWR4_GIBM7|nr:hypothetical protein FVEG_17584 [Fusarium verticillioides 7600]EWG55756.1 hypothetical protein FVEG_17584 [Fusarium verticillioides 7600]